MVWYIAASLAAVQIYPDGSLAFSSATEISLSDMNANIKAASEMYVCGRYLDPMALFTSKVCSTISSVVPEEASCSAAVSASCNFTDPEECAVCVKKSYDFVRWGCASEVVEVPECSDHQADIEAGDKEVITHEELAENLAYDSEIQMCGHSIRARNIWAHGICDAYISTCTEQISSACPFGAAYGNSLGCMNCAMLNYNAIVADEGTLHLSVAL
jgi:hypothetical protein